ncbi:MAG: hypothetical protein AAF569_08820, partial [Pseudomonadota bacterium]
MKTKNVAEWLNQRTRADRLNVLRDTIQQAVEAKNKRTARKLLTSFAFIEAKLEEFGLDDLIADYELAKPLFTGKTLTIIQEILRNSANILTNHPNQLASQLWGRLAETEYTKIQKLLNQALEKSVPWFRSLKSTLTEPGSGLKWVLDDYKSPVLASAILPNGHVVLGYGSGDLIVWDIESRTIVKRLREPVTSFDDLSTEGRRAVTCIVITDDCKVITGSIDGLLRVWNLETEQLVYPPLKGTDIETPALAEAKEMSIGNRLNSISIDPDTNRVAASYND